jgi:IS605 OrfB family transposase
MDWLKMIRTVKVRSPLNKVKLVQVHQFMETYSNCVNYFIVRLWSEKKLAGRHIDKEYINSARERFSLTTRLIQCAGRQALGIVKGQRKKNKNQRSMPRFKNLTANLDRRFWKIADEKNTFEWIRLQSGFTIYIPFNKTRMWNKWVDAGFTLSKSIRLIIKNGHLDIEFFFGKNAPKLKAEGDIEGLDLGYVNLAVCSDGQVVGAKTNEFVKKFHKREKRTHKQMECRAFNELKKLDLSNIASLVVENLKYVKCGTRGMFSRQHNRRLSHWLYAKVIKWLVMRCEEQGIWLEFKSPYKTSQHCPICGKWDRRNRNGEKFKCIFCGHEDHADSVGSQNLKLLGLAGVYSLRSLNSSLIYGCI